MRNLKIFTDGSVNTQLKIGYGAYLLIAEQIPSIDLLQESVKIKRFEDTSSTKLELQTLLWVLHEIIKLTNPNEMNVTIYTDSQNIINLPNRQARLERSNYFSSKNKRLNDYELYQQFYHLTSKLDCRLVKVIGHRNSSSKDQIDKLFALVDKASRKALRKEF